MLLIALIYRKCLQNFFVYCKFHILQRQLYFLFVFCMETLSETCFHNSLHIAGCNCYLKSRTLNINEENVYKFIGNTQISYCNMFINKFKSRFQFQENIDLYFLLFKIFIKSFNHLKLSSSSKKNLLATFSNSTETCL